MRYRDHASYLEVSFSNYMNINSLLSEDITPNVERINYELCQVGERQYWLAHQCSPCEKNCTHMKCEVKCNGEMGMGHLYLILGGTFMA